jgi:phytoene dehydrogenase-like protein
MNGTDNIPPASDAGSLACDALVIGCGMSGLGAAIRMRMFGLDVLIVERHNAPGGLNGFYFKGGRKLDVGLHAMTNFAPPGERGPLSKLYRQLRIRPEQFALCPQIGSRIAFPGAELRFGNGLVLLEEEVARLFPARIDAFRRLVKLVGERDALALDRPQAGPARALVHEILGDPLLAEMILLPLFYYGSALEDDIDLDQFCILFRALYMEGFARPFEGVRVVIRTLLDRYRELGGRRIMRCGVRKIVCEGGRAAGAILDDGRHVAARFVISSAGALETARLCEASSTAPAAPVGHSFAEGIYCFDGQPVDKGLKDTIVFFNFSPRVAYHRPEGLTDLRSGVICVPNNYDFGAAKMGEGMLRVTCLANHSAWAALAPEAYARAKDEASASMLRNALAALPHPTSLVPEDITFRDTFTPLTIERFTGHLGGAIYGTPQKVRDGRTQLDNLFICGTDQGFLGIVGAILGGISIANMHVLRKV